MADESGQKDALKKEILEALEAKYGIVTDACKSIGFNRGTFYEWLKQDPEFKSAVESIQDVALDYAEGKLFEKMSGIKTIGGFDSDGNAIIYTQPPSDTALIFYLKCKGKKRGYVERQENAFVDPDGKPISITLNLNK